MKADKRLYLAYKIALQQSKQNKTIPDWIDLTDNAMALFKEMTEKLNKEENKDK